MKRSLMSLVVAGSWVLWASAANAEITMKITGCFPVEKARYNRDWQVEIWTEGYGGYITDISEDGTFTTDVPEGTKLLASLKPYSDPLEVPLMVEGEDFFSTDWTPAKDGGELIACSRGMPEGDANYIDIEAEELKDDYHRRKSEPAN